jgi:hypothetical protein
LKVKSIQSIQGLGPKISEKLIDHFITEDNVIKAISEGRISEIASIRGIGRKYALKIIQEYHSEDKIEGGIYSDEILKTSDIKRIHEQIIEIIKSFAQTQFIKDKFSLLFPLPAKKLDIIKDRVEYYKANISELKKIDQEVISKIRKLLKAIKPINPVDFRKNMKLKRIIITDDQNEYNLLIENDIEKYARVLLVKSFKEKEASFFNSFDIVIFINKKRIDPTFLNEISNPIILSDWKKADLIPEYELSNFIGPNYNVILTAYKLVKILNHLIKGTHLFSEKFNEIEMEDLEQLITNLNLIDGTGNIILGNNPEFDEYRTIVDDFDSIIADQEIWINESIENQIKKSKAVLDGTQIFSLLQNMDDSNSISFNNLVEFLPLNIGQIIEEILIKGRENIIEKLHLEDPESSVVFDIYPNELNFPIEADNFTIRKLKNKLTKRMRFYEFQFLSKIAKNLHEYRKLVSKIIQILFELDELLAVRELMLTYSLKYPNFYDAEIGLSFQDGKNIFLFKNGIDLVPIDYHIGSIPIAFEYKKDIDNKIIILTGANSGGKTTLLQTIAQITIMAQMGLPVPAKANIGPYNELYYFSKSQGQVSSGAFETSLEMFSDAIVSKEKKIVLMDELEAITEPGAAAKVIGSILELFYQNKDTVSVLVSHLAEQILKVIKIPLRIDGIEANGIKDGKLLVDRNPKFNYFAKSMPFFIIKKLYESCSNPNKREIYQKMMNYFDKDRS